MNKERLASLTTGTGARRIVVRHEPADHLPEAGKMVHFESGAHGVVTTGDVRQPPLNPPVDAFTATGYRSAHIRPLAVRPLAHPERRPTPRGFLFAGSERRRARLSGRSAA